jgi:hypothetical protein
MRFVCLAALAVLAAPASFAQSAGPFVASRPGATEGPIAVPDGYLQIETELASHARSRDNGVKTDSYSLAATTARYGIGNDMDIELVVQPFLRTRVSAGGVTDSTDGIGDVTLRLLKNISGQDGDGPALAVIAFVSLPTAHDGLGPERAEAGGFVTGSYPLAEAWGLAWTLGAAARHAGFGDYEGEASAALQINHAFSDTISGYAEIAGSRAEHGTATTATFDVGAAWLQDATTQWDAGVNLGVTDSADDVAIFAGWAHRF